MREPKVQNCYRISGFRTHSCGTTIVDVAAAIDTPAPVLKSVCALHVGVEPDDPRIIFFTSPSKLLASCRGSNPTTGARSWNSSDSSELGLEIYEAARSISPQQMFSNCSHLAALRYVRTHTGPAEQSRVWRSRKLPDQTVLSVRHCRSCLFYALLYFKFECRSVLRQ